MYVKLSTIKGAASFNNLDPILLEPVALVGSIFLRYFSIFHRIFLVLKKLSQAIKIRSLNWFFDFWCYIYNFLLKTLAMSFLIFQGYSY